MDSDKIKSFIEKTSKLNKTKEDVFPRSKSGKPVPNSPFYTPDTSREFRSDPKEIINDADDAIPTEKVSSSINVGPMAITHDDGHGDVRKLNRGPVAEALTKGLTVGGIAAAGYLLMAGYGKMKGLPLVPMSDLAKGTLAAGVASGVPVMAGTGVKRYMMGKRLERAHDNDNRATSELIEGGYTPHPDRATMIASKINQSAGAGVKLHKGYTQVKRLNEMSELYKELEEAQRRMATQTEKSASMAVRRAIAAREIDDIVSDEDNISTIESSAGHLEYIAGIGLAGQLTKEVAAHPSMQKYRKFATSSVIGPAATAATTAYAGMADAKNRKADAAAIINAGLYAPAIMAAHKLARPLGGLKSIAPAVTMSIPAVLPLAARVYKKIRAGEI